MKDAQHIRPLWLGFLAAALTPAACIMLYSAATGSWSLSPIDLLKGYLFLSVFSVPVSAITILIAGLPLVIWLKRTNRMSATSVSLAAMLTGCLAWGIVTWLTTWKNPVPAPTQLLVGAAIGLACGIVFSLAAGLTIRSSRDRFAARLKW